jgi:hypothetical protein
MAAAVRGDLDRLASREESEESQRLQTELVASLATILADELDTPVERASECEKYGMPALLKVFQTQTRQALEPVNERRGEAERRDRTTLPSAWSAVRQWCSPTNGRPLAPSSPVLTNMEELSDRYGEAIERRAGSIRAERVRLAREREQAQRLAAEQAARRQQELAEAQRLEAEQAARKQQEKEEQERAERRKRDAARVAG